MKRIGFLILLSVLAFSAAAETIPGVEHRVLPNGLEVFLVENHAVPLATVQITFRCGSISQTPETCGLFHLYEHMLFKGNEKYPNQSDFKAAMKELGVGSWNGGTSTEYVTYYFTIPSSKTREGIEFWANAVQYPLLDEKELEAEKKVVINEINGAHNEPDRIFSAGVMGTLFANYPWRRDVSGPVANIEAATTAQMRMIRDTFYVPNNAALFIAGDVDPEETFGYVQRIFADWRPAADPPGVPAAHPLMRENRFLVYPDPGMYHGFAQLQIMQRGPDVGADPEATWAADVLLFLLEDPAGRFRERLFNEVPNLYSKEYIWHSYYTQNDGGQITFGTYLLLKPATDPFYTARQFWNTVQDEVAGMMIDPDYFSVGDFDTLKNILEDRHLLEQEVASDYIDTLSFWWSSAGTEYYASYTENMQAVSFDDIGAYLEKYVYEQPYLITLRVNPEDLQYFLRDPDFVELNADNAYWWKK